MVIEKSLSKRSMLSSKRIAAAKTKKIANSIAFVRNFLRKRGAKIPLDAQDYCFNLSKIVVEEWEKIHGCYVGRVLGCNACPGYTEGFAFLGGNDLESAKKAFKCTRRNKEHILCITPDMPLETGFKTFNATKFKVPTQNYSTINMIIDSPQVILQTPQSLTMNALKVRAILENAPFGLAFPQGYLTVTQQKVHLTKPTAIKFVKALDFMFSPQNIDGFIVVIEHLVVGETLTIYQDFGLIVQYTRLLSD